jgi:hypothetical protein
VRDEDSADLRSMAEGGLVPGARLIVAPGDGTAGSVGIVLDGREGETRIVPAELARQIYVGTDD